MQVVVKLPAKHETWRNGVHLSLTRRRFLTSFALTLVMVPSLAAPRTSAPKNVILLIGDGMGFSEVTLARLALGKADAALAMDSMKYTAFVKTHPADSDKARGIVTDSAAASTAMATGHKTRNGMLGVLPNGKPVRTILEAAQEMGKGTGLVTTVTITHATPAGFASHVPSRGSEAEIAVQYLEHKVDVLMGGGESFFLPQSAEGSKRKDDRDLIDQARQAGYTVARSREEMQKAAGPRLLGLFHKSHMTCRPPEPSIAEMTTKALEVLSANRKGFFLMVEGGQIDFAGHANNTPENVRHTLDFDAAVAVALEFARKRGDTLVIVTADHETGGQAIVAPEAGRPGDYEVRWTSDDHSATMVPLLAEGPGAELFVGVLDNTDIARRIARLWKARLD